MQGFLFVKFRQTWYDFIVGQAFQNKIRLFEIEEEERKRRLEVDRKYYEAKSRAREKKTHKTIEKGGNHTIK